jgi:hypothetical protein
MLVYVFGCYNKWLYANKMSKRLNRNLDYLKKLKGVKKVSKRNDYLKNANDDLVACLVECVANIVRGNVPMTTKQKSNLKCHLRSLRDLSKVRNLKKAKKKLLKQKGGFLPAVLTPILVAAAGTLLRELIAKHI